jgi:hypothetical protein
VSVYLGAFGEQIEVREMTTAELRASNELWLKEMEELLISPI